jgi:hypothetical protein
MKATMVLFLVTLALGFECFGQVSPKEVIYGTVRTDGYQKITKGAFWTTRPEAKLIYEGGTPEGYNVFVLESDYFVRFKNGENNQFDQNYIIFPRGEKVYTDRSGQFYSAMCGNKIEYLRRIDLVTITNEQQQQLQGQANASIGVSSSETLFTPPKNVKEMVTTSVPDTEEPFIPTTTNKKNKKWLWIAAPVAAVAAATITYLVLNRDKHSAPIIGGPAWVPMHRDDR